MMKNSSLIFLLGLLLLNFGCSKDSDDEHNPENVETMEDLVASEDFSFDASKELSVNLSILNNKGNPINDVRVEFLSGDDRHSAKRVITGMTNESGVFNATFKLRSYRDSIFVNTRYIGVPSGLSYYLNSNTMDIQIGGVPQKMGPVAYTKSIQVNPDYAYMGNYSTGTSGGVPEYLEPEGDEIDSDFLSDINDALPEYFPVPDAHPEYLASSNQTNTVILEDADVWITFVHEGAGYRSALCYYAYDKNTPPQGIEYIDSLNVIYPNTSFQGSGGGLNPGDKVYLGTFDAGTEIAWAIIANGWNGTDVEANNPAYYSDYEFNPESSAELRQHNVLLHDNLRNLYLIGFEDLNRGGWCDDDFNDAIFYATSNPIDAIENTETPGLYPDPIDSDGDGVVDAYDDYPDDATKAFDNFYPGQDEFGTLAFEDLWPQLGDYDFNDLVVDYNFNQVANNNNKVVSIISTITVKAVGAGYKNGFGFQLPMSPDLIESVEGINVPGNIVTLAGNNTEAGQEKATIIAFENVYDIFPTISHGYINTDETADYIEPQTLNIEITFNQPLSIDDVGLPPYNPFIFINQEREKEVHLPNYEPTDLASEEYFGTGEDDSNPAAGRYYRDDDNLPWAMHVPTSFDYPKESKSIITGHLVFDNWVLSDGFSFMDWYLDKPQYRNESNLYQSSK